MKISKKNWLKILTIVLLIGVVCCSAVISASAFETIVINNTNQSDRLISSSLEDNTATQNAEAEDDIIDNVKMVEYVGILEPEENPREYPEEFLPYIEEFERINAEYGKEYDYYHLTDEAIYRILSMTIDEFRDYIYGTHENDIAHPSPFDEYKMVETSEPEDDILAGRIIMAESGGYWYLQDGSETDSWTGVLYNEESTDCSTGILYNEESTDEASDPGLGVYRGGAQLYPCD